MSSVPQRGSVWLVRGYATSLAESLWLSVEPILAGGCAGGGAASKSSR